MRKLIICALIIGLWSCRKRVTCEGTVYSRNGFPVSGADVHLYVFGSASDTPTGGGERVTDKDGRFRFFIKVNKRHPMRLEVRSDSGSATIWLGRPKDETNFHLPVALK